MSSHHPIIPEFLTALGRVSGYAELSLKGFVNPVLACSVRALKDACTCPNVQTCRGV